MRRHFGAVAACRYAIAGLVAGSCSNGPTVPLADGRATVKVSADLFSSEWTVTVRNKQGSATGKIFAANDYRRSNIYLTPLSQLVVIEQGGGDAFFLLPNDRPPEYLPEQKPTKRDTDSQRWRYMGVIMGNVFQPGAPECIALLGEGESPYRRRYQRPSHC